MIRRCAVLSVWVAVAFAQTPAFEAASVKAVAKTDGAGYRYQLTPTSLTMRQVSLGYAIRMAYRLRNAWDLVGPDWLDPPTLHTYDFEGRMDQPTSEERMWECLRTLLVERFGLEPRRESRPLPVYLLLRGPGPPKLAPSQKAETKVRSGEGYYEQIFEHVSMAQLALQLGPPTCNRPVLDRTGIDGFFDFTLDRSRYVLDPETGKPIVDWRGAIDTEGSSLRAVRDQLGLEVKADRAPFEVLVVNRVRSAPSAN
jgi:uncharacterized protein (TIGR03435 family)